MTRCGGVCVGEVCGIGCGGVYVGEMCECGVVYVWGSGGVLCMVVITGV